ncbi:Thiamine pathway transporter THI73 [Hyphodiscus hymeniophilus]|uniref:Thiamine pathway transporter THI73 n=1 Tax=Hyphodiscus hymeniophilus TaxID=353542 RepID=A0A9P6VD72_9HELO|nr:Thiamine pathway transporter THI73 [Hyphodiscus hymeniophilus]
MDSMSSDEKKVRTSDVEVPDESNLNSPTATSPEKQNGDLDEAYLFLTSHNVDDDSVDLKALRRKIDWRIVPIMFLCYTMQFVDKVMINYAAVMGINKDLKLKGNDFSNVATAFFIAYLIAEVPNGYILQKVGAGKWLGANVFLWGIAAACHAAAFNYHSLLAARIFLGIFEAAIAPCLMLISSQWYTKSEQAPRFSFWYCGLGAGQIFGGIISFGFQHVKGDFAGWKIMFIVVGLLTSLFGVVAFFILPDTPMKATFLSDAETTALLKHVAANQTGIENHHFKWSHLIEILLDIQIWLLVIMTVLISVSSGVITSYSATLIAGFGYSKPNAALLNMPGGIVSIASTLIVGFGVRHTSHRWAWIVACCVPGMLGGGLMSFAPKHNRAALLAGIYLVNSIVATLTVIYQWTVSNCAGHTKRAMSAAIIAGSFSIGNIIGPQTFQAKDAPGYHPAKITVLATQGAGAVVAFVLFLYYVWANKRKDRKQFAENVEANNWENRTDKENETFRYVY